MLSSLHRLILTSCLAMSAILAQDTMPIYACIGIPAEFSTPARYREMADAGFTTSLTGFLSLDEAVAAMDAAQTAGVKVWVQCPELQYNIPAAVRRLSVHPAFAGYHIGDEPSAAAFAALADRVRQIQQLDTIHPCYINLPSKNTPSPVLGAPTYDDFVEQFITQVPTLPQLSFDYYPTSDGTLEQSLYTSLEIISSAANKKNIPFWAFYQSTLFGATQPARTLPAMRVEIFSNLVYGAQCIQAYTYWLLFPSERDAPIDRDGNRTPVYDLVRTINGEVRALSRVFYGARVQSVGHAGSYVPPNARAFVPTSTVGSLDIGSGSAVVSFLRNGSTDYIALVNKDIINPLTITIGLADPQNLLEVRKDGADRAVTSNSFTIAPGDVLIFSKAGTSVPGNAAPLVNAGPDRNVSQPSVRLAATALDDGLPFNSTVSITWSKISGPGTVTFAQPASAATSATFSDLGTYVLRLHASDGTLSAEDTVTVVVTASTTLANGSFETPSVSGYMYNPLDAEWNFTGNSIVQANRSAWGASNAPDGRQTAVLQGQPDGLGAISQTVFLTSGTYQVAFKAARRSGQIQPVRFSVDGATVGGELTPGSDAFAEMNTAEFTVATGTHEITLAATNGSDDRSTFIDQVRLVVIGNLPPAVSVSVATRGFANVPLTMSANASDSDGTIAKVEFFVGSVVIGTDTTAPYSAIWTIPGLGDGYSVTAKATDNLGASTTSAVTVVTIVGEGPTANGTGLTAAYFSSPNFGGTQITRTDASVAFDWGTGSPASGIGAEGFSVRWTGQVQAQFSETYTFTTLSDDGVRLWINGQLLIDNWTDHAPMENSGTITLEAGQKYDVKMEYFENGGGAVAKLYWASPSTAKQIIPMSQLFPSEITTIGDLPAGWTAQDVGGVAVGGSTTLSNGTWTVSGSGSDIWNRADGCRFASQRITGDLQVTAQVTGLTNTNIWAKAGVMIRESLASGSRHASTFATASNGIAYQRRLVADGVSSHTAGPSSPAPYWVRIERVGNIVISSGSPNGTTWTEIRRETITMSAAVYVGLAVTSHNNGALCTATFTNVQVVGVAAAAN